MEPSSANTGFFQELPVLRNQFHEDVSFRRVLKLFVPPQLLEEVGPEIAQLGEDVLSDKVYAWVTDSERNLPYLRGSGRNAFGKQTSDLIVTEGWRKLQEYGQEIGGISYNYDTNYGPYSRVLQMLRLQLWEASSGNTTCPGAMTDGAARLLQRHLASDKLDPTQRRVFQNAYDHLISRDPARAWTSGQWMTERPGGSDVSRTETVARYAPFPTGAGAPLASAEENIPLGPWEISGFKWFSSATDSNMTVLLARTHPSKGLSAFLAPMRRHTPDSSSSSAASAAAQKRPGTELNGVRIQRLKDKLGTRGLPTAELELSGMRAWLVGEEGRGIQEISTILNITRMHCSTSTLGFAARGLAVARAFTRVREIGAGRGRRVPLRRSPLHMRTLAGMTGDYHAMMLLTFYTVYLVGLDEKRGSAATATGKPFSPALAALTPPPRHVAPLLRVLSSLHKAYVCKQAIPLLYACLESLGGVGYLVNSESEHLNVARLFRDGCVNAIWEGTTDVLSTDMLRALKHPASGRQSLEALDWLVAGTLGGSGEFGGEEAAAGALAAWRAVREKIDGGSQEALLVDARDILFRVAEVLMAALLLVDARSDGAPEAQVMCRRYLAKKGFAGEGSAAAGEEGLAMDTAIVYGPGGLEGAEAAAKL